MHPGDECGEISPTIRCINEQSCIGGYLDQLGERRPLPKTLVCDNGTELTSKAMFFWSARSGTILHVIQLGKPTQNAFVESFNARFRYNLLNQHWFRDLHEARQPI